MQWASKSEIGQSMAMDWCVAVPAYKLLTYAISHFAIHKSLIGRDTQAGEAPDRTKLTAGVALSIGTNALQTSCA